MDIRISPAPLAGSVTPPPSKSDAHRALILAALCGSGTRLICPQSNRDIDATADCLNSLGGRIVREGDSFVVTPVSPAPGLCQLDCGESGSTLRFMLPVAAAVGANARFLGSGRLGDRPLAALLDAMKSGGVDIEGERLPITISGKLRPGRYELPGDVSSQFITGMLMALAYAGGGSVRLTSRLESSGYVDMTLGTLEKFGVDVSRTEDTFTVSGRLSSPGVLRVETDWSAAAFFFQAYVLGGQVEIAGLDYDSAQPDRAAATLFGQLGSTIDVSGCPDLFPALAMAACSGKSDTEFVGGARLRLKESDRIASTAAAIRGMGGRCTEHADGMTVYPSVLTGGEVDGQNDHRIVMAAAIAASFAKGDTIIRGAEAVNKSYPDFFRDFQQVGGVFSVL